jgi:hypothetical protein
MIKDYHIGGGTATHTRAAPPHADDRGHQHGLMEPLDEPWVRAVAVQAEQLQEWAALCRGA